MAFRKCQRHHNKDGRDEAVRQSIQDTDCIWEHDRSHIFTHIYAHLISLCMSGTSSRSSRTFTNDLVRQCKYFMHLTFWLNSLLLRSQSIVADLGSRSLTSSCSLPKADGLYLLQPFQTSLKLNLWNCGKLDQLAQCQRSLRPSLQTELFENGYGQWVNLAVFIFSSIDRIHNKNLPT